MFSFEFATGVSLDHHLISRVMGVLTSRGILGLVVLCDAVLLPLLDALPIGFKEMFSRASWPKASCVGVACVVVCTIH